MQTQVFVNIHALHHNPSLWGPDHHIYDPTRWYDEKRTAGLSQWVLPYSTGKRNCVGQTLANANVLKMTTTLLRCYEFDWVNVEENMVVVAHGDSDLRTPLFVRCRMRREAFRG